MKKEANNYAFIDSQNLNLSIREFGWKLDFGRFRVYLKEKYAITKTFLFIGYVDDLRAKLEYKKKRPPKDKTLEGVLFHW